MVNALKVKIVKLHQDATIPKYAHAGDVCFDLVSVESVEVAAGRVVVVGTGLAMQPEPGYELQIRPRSGLAAKHGITVLNSPATLEPTYTGEIKVILHNTSTDSYSVKKGDRIAQAVFKEYRPVEFTEVDKLAATERGARGPGSSGK